MKKLRSLIVKSSTRWVIITSRYAFKFPSLLTWRCFLRGLLANMQEVQLSGKDPILCPVVFSLPGGFLVVMPRALPLQNDFDFTGLYQSLVREGYELPVERKADSFGILNGAVVAVDYGT